MDKILQIPILLIPVLVPLAVGFILLFLPGKMRSLHKLLALVVSIIAFAAAVKIFNSGRGEFAWGAFQIDNLNLDLLLTTTALNKFVLLFAMGFVLLISIY